VTGKGAQGSEAGGAQGCGAGANKSSV